MTKKLKSNRYIMICIIMVMIAVAITGCSSPAGVKEATPTVGVIKTPTIVATKTPTITPRVSKTHVIVFKDLNDPVPKEIIVKIGDLITFKNVDNESHTYAPRSYKDDYREGQGGWVEVLPGTTSIYEMFKLTKVAHEFYFVCTLHPHGGKITVIE